MSATTDLTRGEIYLQAAALIRKHGLATGGYSVGDALCAVGAIRTVLFGKPGPSIDLGGPDSDAYLDVMVDLSEYLYTTRNVTYLRTGCGLTAWSDHSTAAEVIEALHKAASAVRTAPCHHTLRES